MEAELRARKEGADGEARVGLRRWEPDMVGEGARARKAEGPGWARTSRGAARGAGAARTGGPGT